MIIFFTFLIIIINFKNGEKKNIYLFFQCPFLLQKIYEYFKDTDLYRFFFPVKTYKDPFIYKDIIQPSFSFLNPETGPGLTTTQGTINYGSRLISNNYDGSNFEENSDEESLGIVERVTNTNPETEPGLTTTQGKINYGSRLISKIYDGSNFEDTNFEESLAIVEHITNTELETQTIWII